MKTLKITKADLNEQNEYIKSDSLEFDGHVQIEADLGYVRFRCYLSAKGGIVAKAGSGIKAGWGIKAGEGIKAGLSIICKSLKVELRIFAGLCAWRMPEPNEMEIRADSIEGAVAFGTLVTTDTKREG